jgi:hypothetical protein
MKRDGAGKDRAKGAWAEREGEGSGNRRKGRKGAVPVQAGLRKK